MVGSGTGSGSGKFARFREKGPDSTGSGSATLVIPPAYLIRNLVAVTFRNLTCGPNSLQYCRGPKHALLPVEYQPVLLPSGLESPSGDRLLVVYPNH